MGHPPRRLVLASVLVAIGAAQVASANPSLPTASSTTYIDERGEQKGAPGISKIIVSNDDAGVITFRVLTPNRQRLTRDMRVRLPFSARGQRYFFLVDPFKPSPATVGLYRVEPAAGGGSVGFGVPAPSLRFRYARGARFSLHVSDLGVDPTVSARVAITFYVLIYDGVRFTPGTGYDLTGIRQDRAPSKHPKTFRYVAVFDS